MQQFNCFRLSVLGVLLLAAALPALAQQPDSLLTRGNFPATLHRDTAIARLEENYAAYNRKKDYVEGYRIQINYTNVRDEVYQSKGAMYKQFPELASYVEYEQPYYKLRIGDFKTRLQATYYLQQVILLYPGAFIVKDKIKVK